MNEMPIDVIRAWTEEIRVALRAAGLRGFTLVDLHHTICASLGPGRRKANISWLENGREWFLQLTGPEQGLPEDLRTEYAFDYPARRVLCIAHFDIFTVDCDLVTSIVVRHLCDKEVSLPSRL